MSVLDNSTAPETIEPLWGTYRGLKLSTNRPPGGGVMLIEMLNILSACTGKVYPGQTLATMGVKDPHYWHMLIEAKALAYADLNANNGDPRQNPDMADRLKKLTSMDHANSLCGKISPDKAMALTTPGEGTSDTIVLTVGDRWGNMVSATPSGGWLQSSPVIPELGFCLGTRGQMFWLEEGHPASLAPGKRPRTTLSPTMALRDGDAYLAWGSPGGDQQDQWITQFFLRHVHANMNLQEAIDAPAWHSEHFPISFWPRTARPVISAACGISFFSSALPLGERQLIRPSISPLLPSAPGERVTSAPKISSSWRRSGDTLSGMTTRSR